MANRRDVILLDLLVLLPCLAARNRQELVDLARVIHVVARNRGHDIEQWLELAPVQRSQIIERLIFLELAQTSQPVLMRGLRPSDDFVEVALA